MLLHQWCMFAYAWYRMLAEHAKEGPRPNKSQTSPKQKASAKEHLQGTTRLKGETAQKEAGTIPVKECRSEEARATVHIMRWRGALRGLMGRERDQANTNGVSAHVTAA
jgi:hypothetical protein